MARRLSDGERALRAITEAEHSRAIEDALTLFGWRWTHFRTSWTRGRWRTPVSGDPGFPDYLAVRGGRVLAIEAKREAGRLTPEQEAWLAALEAAGVETHVVRPSGLEAFLETLRRPNTSAGP